MWLGCCFRLLLLRRPLRKRTGYAGYARLLLPCLIAGMELNISGSTLHKSDTMPSSSTKELSIRPVRHDNKVKGKMKAKAKAHSERLSVIKQLNLAAKREWKRNRERGEWEQERTGFNPIKCRARIGVIIEMTMKYADPARPLPLKQSPQSPKQRQLQFLQEKFADARQIRKTWDNARNLHRYQNAALKLIAFIAEATANKSQRGWKVN